MILYLLLLDCSDANEAEDNHVSYTVVYTSVDDECQQQVGTTFELLIQDFNVSASKMLFVSSNVAIHLNQ